jgi:hypothetical protein
MIAVMVLFLDGCNGTDWIECRWMDDVLIYEGILNIGGQSVLPEVCQLMMRWHASSNFRDAVS